MDRPAAWRALAIDLEGERPFCIGGATVDPVSRDAEFPGGSERLQPQTLKVLVALVRRKGEVVTRAELIDSCWNGRIVGEDVINRSISLLRDFAERAGGFSIETVPKTGYRLLENVSGRVRSWRVQGIVVAVLLLVGASSWLLTRPHDLATGQSINLLPFTSEATQSPAPEVAASARQAVADTLGDQGFTVWTSPARRDRADVNISGKVIRAADVVHAAVRIDHSDERLNLASLQFEVPVSQAGTLPTQIGAQVSAALSLAEELAFLDRRFPTEATATTELLQQARLLVTGEDALRVYPIAGRLARQEPDSALAQWLLAMNTGLALGNLPRDDRSAAIVSGRHAANRAETLAPGSGDARIPWCLLHSQVRMIECENRLRAGMRADPDPLLLPQYLSELLSGVGRSEEALQFARLGFARHRYMPAEIARLLRSLEATGHPGEAERLYEQSRRWWPNYRWLFWSRVGGMQERGDFDRLERFLSESDSQMLLRGFETPALFTALRNRDLTEVRRECQVVTDPSVRIVVCMLGLAQLGDLDGAYRIADKLYPRIVGRTLKEEEELWLLQWEGPPYAYLVGRGAEPMRRDPRFLDVAERIGLLTYWRSGRLPDFCRSNSEPVCGKILRPQP